jgi:hypothetical protein
MDDRALFPYLSRQDIVLVILVDRLLSFCEFDAITYSNM